MRRWSSGYDGTLPTSRPEFDSRATHFFAKASTAGAGSHTCAQPPLFILCILGRVVKALDLSPNGHSPRGFEPRRMHSIFLLLASTDVSLAQLGRALGF